MHNQLECVNLNPKPNGLYPSKKLQTSRPTDRVRYSAHPKTEYICRNSVDQTQEKTFKIDHLEVDSQTNQREHSSAIHDDYPVMDDHGGGVTRNKLYTSP